jgi:uncharacterized membrane protein YgcG
VQLAALEQLLAQLAQQTQAAVAVVMLTQLLHREMVVLV